MLTNLAHFNKSIQTYHQNVGESVQNDQYDLGLFNGQEVTQGLDGPQLDQVGYLFHSPSRGQVGHRPHSFFLALVISL